MAMDRLIVGSRGSPLALRQANWVKACLEEGFPGFPIEISIIKTSGDIVADAPLSKIGGKGLFTKEIEEALLEGRIDLAVHSLKDLPTALPSGLQLAAITEREEVRDAFVSNSFKGLNHLPPKARIGTSSLRRQSQLLYSRKDLEILNLRGNLDTRLRKLDLGQYDAIVLACAGLIRLGHTDRITERIPVGQICPAIGQGALGIEARRDDGFTADKLKRLNHRETQLAAEAERAFLKRLGGGCQVPIAGFAHLENQQLRIQGVIASPDGLTLFRDTEAGEVDNSNDAETLGTRLAEKLLARGAQVIIDTVFDGT
jgi:hydroxymethylbilane synthase